MRALAVALLGALVALQGCGDSEPEFYAGAPVDEPLMAPGGQSSASDTGDAHARYDSNYQNVYGSALASCSTEGQALTGYTRTGYCVTHEGDAGSHHICIDLGATSGGNFCDVTGQPDWCSSQMQCDAGRRLGEERGLAHWEGGDGPKCPVRHWCVCQWAFASYIQGAGGCDYIQDIKCDAINLVALKAYRRQASMSRVDIIDALNCLESRCGVSQEGSRKSEGGGRRLNGTFTV